MCVPGKLVYLYVGPLHCRRKLYNNDVMYGGTALSGDDRLLRLCEYSACLNGTWGKYWIDYLCSYASNSVWRHVAFTGSPVMCLFSLFRG